MPARRTFANAQIGGQTAADAQTNAAVKSAAVGTVVGAVSAGGVASVVADAPDSVVESPSSP